MLDTNKQTQTHRWIMQRRVQHNDGKAQHVAGVGVGENVRIQLAVPLGKAFHHPVNLLRLSRQPERPQELSKKKKIGGKSVMR